MSERIGDVPSKTGRKTAPSLIEAGNREARVPVADFLGDVMASDDPADRFFGQVFLDNVDLKTAFFDADSRVGERVLSAPMIKDCKPPVWLGLRLRTCIEDANVSLLVEKDRVRAGHGVHTEVGVHYKEGAGIHRHPIVRTRESVHITDDWFVAALYVKIQLVRATQLMLAPDSAPSDQQAQQPRSNRALAFLRLLRIGK